MESEASLETLQERLGDGSGPVWQCGSHIHIPRVNGRMFVVTDLEGHKEYLEAIFRKHDLLTRMLKDDPNDQVHLSVLGDTIDRNGRRASEILEFLYELKMAHGLWDKIHILSGNHELGPDRIQKSRKQGGFYDEVVVDRKSYSQLGDPAALTRSDAIAWCKDHFPQDGEFPSLRVALWRTFNEAFEASPLTITTENGLFLSHAGITNRGPFEVIEAALMGSDVSKADGFKALARAWRDPSMVKDLTWSDFQMGDTGISLNYRGVNKEGQRIPGPGLAFGIDAARSFLGLLGKRMHIRGHQYAPPNTDVKLGEGTWAVDDTVVTTNTGTFREYVEVGLREDVVGTNDLTVHRL